jgi:hypothetical protein
LRLAGNPNRLLELARERATLLNKKSDGSYLPSLVVPLQPTLAALLTAALLTATLLTATLLTATLFFLLASLTFTLFSLAILLSPLLSGGRGFAWLVWILLCVHDAFLCYLGSVALHDLTFLIKSAWKPIRTETHNRAGGWLCYQTKPYSTRGRMVVLRYPAVVQLS